MSAEKEGKKITVLYSNSLVELTCAEEDVWNCTSGSFIAAFGRPGTVYNVFDWRGKRVRGGMITTGAQKIEVPAGGMVTFRKK